jgi:hypothetical protein
MSASAAAIDRQPTTATLYVASWTGSVRAQISVPRKRRLPNRAVDVSTTPVKQR